MNIGYIQRIVYINDNIIVNKSIAMLVHYCVNKNVQNILYTVYIAECSILFTTEYRSNILTIRYYKIYYPI